MLQKTAMYSLAALTLGSAILEMHPAWAQATIQTIDHYSGERMHSEFWRQHYRNFRDEDHGNDDNIATQFDQPIGEGVR